MSALRQSLNRRSDAGPGRPISGRKSIRHTESVVRFAVVVAAVVLLVLAVIWGFQRRLIYLPDTAGVASAATVLPGARDVVLEADDGVQLGAWLIAVASRTAASRYWSPTATRATERPERRWREL